MNTYIKYLISFLLVFGLTVNECSIYSQPNSADYQQVSHFNVEQNCNSKHSELHVYKTAVFSVKALPFVFITHRNLHDAYSAKVQTILKLRVLLHKRIHSIKQQHIFSHTTTTSSNHYSSLHIA